MLMAGGRAHGAVAAGAAAMFSSDESLWIGLGATASMAMGLLLVHVVSLV